MKNAIRLLPILLLMTLSGYAQQEKLGGTSFAGGTEGFQGTKQQFVITTSALPSVIAGAAYSQTLTAANGVTPFAWTIMFGSLPPGLTLNSSTGLISGTATTLGNYLFTVLATDATSPTHKTATRDLSISVTCTQFAITSNPILTPATVGTLYTFQFNSSGGQGAVAWAASGLSPPLAVSSGGLLSGTPTLAGTQLFTVTATDSCSVPQSINQNATLVVKNPVQIVTVSPLPNGSVGQPYNVQFAVQGGTPPYAWSVSAGSLPGGLTLSGTGSLSGTPTIAGTFSFTVQVSDNLGVTSSTPFTLTIGCPPVSITTSALPNGAQGSPYNFQATSTGGTAPLLWAATGLPNGLSMSGSGVISGTPTNTGPFTAHITVSDACSPVQTDSADLPLTVFTGLTITTPPVLPNGTVGVPYSANNIATGGVPPYQWTVPSGPIANGAQDILDWMSMKLPDRLNFHLTGGATPKYVKIDAGVLWEIKGANGNPWDIRYYDKDFTYQVYTDNNDANQQAACQAAGYSSCFVDPFAYKQIVTPRQFTPRYFVPGSTVTILVPPVLQGGGQVNAYIKTTNCGADNQPVAFLGNVKTVTSNGLTMPAGIATWGGDVGVQPTIETDYYYSGNVSGVYVNRERFYFVRNWGWVSWDHATLQSGVYVVDQGSTNNIKTSGGTPTPNFGCKIPALNLAGVLPPGVTSSAAPEMNMASNTGVISGTPTTTGAYSFTVQVEDSIGTITQQVESLTVSCPVLSMTSTSPIPLATQGQAYSFQFSAAGGLTPLQWAVVQGSLPAGLNLSGTGSLTGTPTATGVFSFVVQAVDGCNPQPQSVQGNFQLSVQANNGPLTIVTTSPLPTATEGVPYTSQVTAVGGTTPYGFSLSSGTLPAGLALNGAGLISGTPTSAGTSGFTVKATDALLVLAFKALSLTVVCPPMAITSTSPLAAGTANSPYSFQFTSSGGVGSKAWSLASGVLPIGLTLSGSGLLSGTPTVAATYNFTVRVLDSCSPTPQPVTAPFSVIINPAPVPLSITTPSPLISGTESFSYSSQLNATGGTAPYAWSVQSGALPGGLSLAASGLISGTPTSAGNFTFAAKVTDNVSATAAANFTLLINCPALGITSPSPLPAGEQANPYTNFQFTSTGGISPVAWSVSSGAFPAGMSMNGSGLLTGTPGASGSFSIGITATDSCSPTPTAVPKTFALSIIPALAISTTSPLPAATEGVGYGVTVNAVGGTPAYTWSLVSGSLPPGLSLTGTSTTGACLVALPAGSGTHSGADWNNALVGLPSTLVRTNTYYLGDGAYSAYNFTTTGTTPTTIRKAISTDHCTDTGWNAGTMGSSQAIFSGTPTAWNSTSTGNYTIDGQTGTGETGSTYGIKLLNAGTCSIGGGCGGRTLILDNNVPNVTVNHVEIQGGGLGAGADATEHLIWMQGTGALLDHIFAHDTECDFMQGYGPGNFTVQNSYFYKNGNGGGSPHCQLMWANGMSNFTWRYNSVHDVGGSAIWTFATGSCLAPSTCNDNINIYGNRIWLSNPPASGVNFAGIGDGVFACINSGVICTNVHFYNNTIALMKQYNGQAMNTGNFLENSGDVFTSKNNLYFNNNGNSGTYATAPIVDHNSYLGTGGTDTRCTTACVTNAGAGNPFIASATGNFQLTADTSDVNNWFPLGSPYNVDTLGNLITTDRGAYQFNGSPASTSPAGTISGTPTTAGTYNFSLQVTDSLGATATKAFQIVVSCTPLTITSTSPLPAAAQNQPYSFQFSSSGGAGTAIWSGSSIPAGLSLSPTGALTGTPTGSGTSSLSINATDSCQPVNQVASGSFSLTISVAVPPLVITTASPLPGGTQTVPYSSQMTASGGVPPYAWTLTAGALPGGLGPITAGGLIAGTPTTIGTSSFTVQVADSAGHTTPGSFSITISCTALSITSAATLPGGTQNQAYSDQLAASGGIGTLAWSLFAGTLPTGVSVSGAGLISGTPSNSGAFSPQIRVTDQCSTPQTATKTFSLAINPAVVPLQITTSPTLPSGTTTIPYNVTLSATGGVPPYSAWTVTVGTLPTGLSLNASTGVISGTPSVVGTSAFTVRVQDSVATTATLAMSLAINAVTGADNRYCSSANVVTNLPADGPVSQPLANCINTAISNTPSPGAVVNVTAGNCGSLQTAFSTAVAGQTIVIPALNGAVQDVFTNCPVTASANGNASNYITVRTSAIASLPTEGNRVSPAWAGIPSLHLACPAPNTNTECGRPAYSQPTTPGVYMPKIVSNGPTVILNGSFWRFIGLELTTTSGVNTSQVVQQNTAGSHIILDRVSVHGGNSATGQDRDNIQAAVRFIGCASCAVIDSYLYDTHCLANGTCTDSQAVFGGGSSSSTDGPIKVVDNFLETSGESILTGGGGVGTTTVAATDLEIRRNHMFKPLFWKANDSSYFGTSFQIKNCMEYKNTVRSLVEGNILEDDWAGQSDQHGVCILLDSRNQNLSYSGVASATGNTLTWNSGSQFQSNIVSPTCAPGGCHVTFNGVACVAVSFISVTKITVNCPGGGGGGGTITNNWVQVSTPAGATHIRDFAFNPSNNHWYLADRVSGFWISTNQGSSWTQINSGIASLTGHTITWDATHNQLIAGTSANSTFYRSSNEGATAWTVIPQSNAGTAPAVTGSIISSNGNLIDGGIFGTSPTGGTFFSTNAGSSTAVSSYSANANCPIPGGVWSLLENSVTNDAWSGTEECGVYRSTNNGANWAPASPPDQNYTGGIFIGNVQGLTYDNSGNMLMSAQGGIWKAAGSGGTYTWTNVKPTGGAPNGRSLGRDSTGCLYWGHSGATPTDSVYRSCDAGVTWNPFDVGLPISLEGWKFIQNPADGQMYVNLQNGATNVGTIWRTVGSGGGSGQPPQVANATFIAATPGLNPSANTQNIVFRYNQVKHAASGLQISNPPSDNGDISLGGSFLSAHDDSFDDIDGGRWQTGTDCCNYGFVFQVQNFEGGASNIHDISIWHVTGLSTYSTGTNASIGGAAATGNQTIAGSSIGNFRFYDNIITAGWVSSGSTACPNTGVARTLWICWTPPPQLCFDNNFMAVSTLAATGTGSFSRNNPVYPSGADNGFCPYSPLKGNTLVGNATTIAGFPTFQFTSLNGANGGNYQLLIGSPYHNKASDGTDPGVNWPLLQQNIAGVQ